MQIAQALRRTAVAAGVVFILGGVAQAQGIPEHMLATAMKNAKPAEKRLTKLPPEFSAPAAPARQTVLPQMAPGAAGGRVAPAADVSVQTDNVKSDSDAINSSPGTITPNNYGCSEGGCPPSNLNTIFHYSDSRLDPGNITRGPYRASGYFLHTFDNANFFYCTATLISNSILVLAAHCVYDTTANKYITAGTFFPACTNCNGGGTLVEPYGHATMRFKQASPEWIKAANINDALDQGWDVAVVTLNKRAAPATAVEIGSVTGFLGFCYTNCLQPYWQLSQLGYPNNYDGGNRMQRGEHIEQSDTRDFIFGSGMEGGSSGGPHISNMGQLADTSASPGQSAVRNRIFAVTSWGYVDATRKIQGASPLSGPANINNFKGLFNAACTNARTAHGPGSCALLP